jgi:hypothetical protein
VLSTTPYNIIVGLTLERYIGDKDIGTNINKRDLSYSIINIIKCKYLKALKRPN